MLINLSMSEVLGSNPKPLSERFDKRFVTTRTSKFAVFVRLLCFPNPHPMDSGFVVYPHSISGITKLKTIVAYNRSTMPTI